MKGTNRFMKKLVICLFAALTVFALATGASAATNNGGVVGAAENVVGGAVNGAENIVNGVVNGAESVVNGAANGAGNLVNGNQGTIHNAQGNASTAPGTTNGTIAAAEEKDALERRAAERANERNPSTGVELGFIELMAVGTTMLTTAALAKKRR